MKNSVQFINQPDNTQKPSKLKMLLLWGVELLLLIAIFLIFMFVISCSTSKTTSSLVEQPSVEEKQIDQQPKQQIIEEQNQLSSLHEDEVYDRKIIKRIFVKTHITTIETLPYDSKTDKFYLTFLDDDNVYQLTKENVHFDTYVDLIMKDNLKDVFYKIQTYRQKIISIEAIDDSIQSKLREKYLAKFHENYEKTVKDRKTYNSFWIVESSVPKDEKFLTHEQIENLFEHSKKEMIFLDRQPSPIRCYLLDAFVKEHYDVSAYKAIVTPKMTDIKPMILQHKFNSEEKSWLMLNVYKEVKEIKKEGTTYYQISWTVFDPYFFNKPLPLHEALKSIEFQSNLAIKHIIVNPSAYGYRHKEGIALYE